MQQLHSFMLLQLSLSLLQSIPQVQLPDLYPSKRLLLQLQHRHLQLHPWAGFVLSSDIDQLTFVWESIITPLGIGIGILSIVPLISPLT